MRNITKFVVITGVGENPDQVISNSRKRGFEYPMPHFLITLTTEGKPVVQKMRPLGSRCALLRDAKIADEGIGFVVTGFNSKLNDETAFAISKIISALVEDLSIPSYSIISDEINEDRRVILSKINPSAIPSLFFKIR